MRTWVLVMFVVIASIVTFAFVSQQNRELTTRRDACAPFAVIGEVAHKGKRLAVCDGVDGPVTKEVR